MGFFCQCKIYFSVLVFLICKCNNSFQITRPFVGKGIKLNEEESSSYCRLTNTRPNIVFCVNNLSQFIYAPNKYHQ